MAKRRSSKQLAKWLPLSAEFNSAVVMDGTVRVDTTPAKGRRATGLHRRRGGRPRRDRTGAADVAYISTDQIAELGKLFAAQKIDDEPTPLDWLAQAVDHPVDRISDLTAAEAAQVFEILSAKPNSQPPERNTSWDSTSTASPPATPGARIAPARQRQRCHHERHQLHQR